jgi:DNA-binding transcriptional MocR family regulator
VGRAARRHRRRRAVAAASERGVAFVKGTDFLLDGGRNTLRLAYSGVTADQIDEGVARLAEAYNAQRKSATV